MKKLKYMQGVPNQKLRGDYLPLKIIYANLGASAFLSRSFLRFFSSHYIRWFCHMKEHKIYPGNNRLQVTWNVCLLVFISLKNDLVKLNPTYRFLCEIGPEYFSTPVALLGIQCPFSWTSRNTKTIITCFLKKLWTRNLIKSWDDWN